MQTKSCWSVQILLGSHLEKATVLIRRYYFSPLDLVCKVELGLQKEAACRQMKKTLLYYYHQIMRSFRLESQYQYGRKRQLKPSITYAFLDTGHLITVTSHLRQVLANLAGPWECCTSLSFSLCWGQTLPATLLLKKKTNKKLQKNPSVLENLDHFLPMKWFACICGRVVPGDDCLSDGGEGGKIVSLKVYPCCKQSTTRPLAGPTRTEGPTDPTSHSGPLWAELPVMAFQK